PKGAVLRLGTVRLRHHSRLMRVAISPDGQRAVSTGHGESSHWSRGNPIRVWNLNTGNEMSRLVGHTANTLEIVLSPDGKTLASAGGEPRSDNSVRLWDIALGTQIRLLKPSANLG